MDFLLSYLFLWKPIGYIIVFLGMILEGDAVLFLAAFLTHQGIFNFLPMFLTVLWGVLFGDNLWYSLGSKLKDSPSKLNRWAEKLAKPFDEHLKERPMRVIFISKFTYGLNHAILMRAGALKIKWKKLEQSDILAAFCWMLIVGGLGYFSGASFYLFKRYLKFGETALLLGVSAFVALEYFLTKRSKKKL